MNQVSRRSGNSAPPGVQGSPAAMRALIGFPPRRSAVGVVVGAAVVLGVVGVVGTWPRAAPVVVATLLFAVGGAGAGVLARVVLARMRRGARVRAPVCEVAVAVFWGSVGAAWGAGVLPGPWVPALLGLGWLAVAGSVVDVLHHRLPDALTLPALPVAVVVLLPLGPDAVGRAVAGSVVAWPCTPGSGVSRTGRSAGATSSSPHRWGPCSPRPPGRPRRWAPASRRC